MQVFFLGGASEVGATCTLVEIAGKRILIDCGMRMKGDSLPDLQTVQTHGGIDAIVVTHAHMDHTGNLPVINTAYPLAPVYMTHPTQALVRVLLYDSLKIMEHEDEIPLFDEKQVENLLAHIVSCGFHESISIFEDSDIRLCFYPAGHILGAACVWLESSNGSLFCTGDVSVGAQCSIEGLSFPKNLRPDACIIESTYGNRLHANRKIECERLVAMVENVFKRGGKVLIPAFAIGRAQEVLLILRGAIGAKQLSAYPIYVDGMVRSVCNIYKSFPSYLRQSLAKRIWNGEPVFHGNGVENIRDQNQREDIMACSDPCCVVASSGMLSGGASAWYAEMLAGDPLACIAITGYQDEESPGRQLQELFSKEKDEDRKWNINGKEIPIRCETATYSLSAHADRTELQGILMHLKPKRVFLVHGDNKALANMHRTMSRDYMGRTAIPVNGQSYALSYRSRDLYTLRPLPSSLNQSGCPDQAGLKMLHDHLCAEKFNGPWSVMELLLIWGVPEKNCDEIRDMTLDRLNLSPWFACDARKLYLFHLSSPTTSSSSPDNDNSKRMEFNAMCAKAQEMFPEETGRYKTSVHVEEGSVCLNFHFPAVARERYAEQLADFEHTTGWRVELNQHPNTSHFEPLLRALLGERARDLQQVAWFLDRNLVCVRMAESYPGLLKVCEQFRRETGLDLDIKSPQKYFSTREQKEPQNCTQPGAPPAPQDPCMHQHEAMELIRKTFDEKPVRIFKISLKSDALGKYIQVQFLTPALGERHSDLLQNLREATGWRISWSRKPRQAELIGLARECLNQRKLAIKRNPSILPNMSVRVIAPVPVEPEMKTEISRDFEKQTGVPLLVEQ